MNGELLCFVNTSQEMKKSESSIILCLKRLLFV